MKFGAGPYSSKIKIFHWMCSMYLNSDFSIKFFKTPPKTWRAVGINLLNTSRSRDHYDKTRERTESKIMWANAVEQIYRAVFKFLWDERVFVSVD
jgi:hypothetical protein